MFLLLHQGSARSCNTHLSSKKLLFTTEEKYYRKLQVKVERTIACGCPAPIRTSTIQLLHLSPREGGWRGKIVRAGELESSSGHCVSYKWEGSFTSDILRILPVKQDMKKYSANRHANLEGEISSHPKGLQSTQEYWKQTKWGLKLIT